MKVGLILALWCYSLKRGNLIHIWSRILAKGSESVIPQQTDNKMDLGPGKLVCHSHIGGNVFARSGRKREEMGSDKFGSLSGYIKQCQARRSQGVGGQWPGCWAAQQHSAPTGQQSPHGADRKASPCSSHLQGQKGHKSWRSCKSATFRASWGLWVM